MQIQKNSIKIISAPPKSQAERLVRNQEWFNNFWKMSSFFSRCPVLNQQDLIIFSWLFHCPLRRLGCQNITVFDLFQHQCTCATEEAADAALLILSSAFSLWYCQILKIQKMAACFLCPCCNLVQAFTCHHYCIFHCILSIPVLLPLIESVSQYDFIFFFLEREREYIHVALLVSR